MNRKNVIRPGPPKDVVVDDEHRRILIYGLKGESARHRKQLKKEMKGTIACK